VSANPYETRRYLDEYLLFHYREDYCPFSFVPRPWLRFQSEIRKACLLPMRFKGPTHGLDLGCAVGRFTFELSSAVNDVLGIDTSKAFIRAARQLVTRRTVVVRIHESGKVSTSRRLALPKRLRKGEVEFRVGDALDLSSFPDGYYHVISAINLLDRLPHPRRLLEQLPRLVPAGGQLILASPFTWLEEFTPRQDWLNVDQVEALLAPAFRLARRRDIPFLIREHRRKYQLGISNVLTFVRRRNSK
jgi:SAM-dependent methyltransferase